MFGLFSLGFLALVAAARDKPSMALALFILGYAVIAILDPIAARRPASKSASAIWRFTVRALLRLARRLQASHHPP
ncbi:hypothetical protein GGR33_003500 [Methylobacterium brachythecii]|uniref:Uncharacterized protein n=1 Tax=Methylobacterium brachythecii TaxID=1176177 RepID=A0A7W6AK63_9HYPH|nr:hypothetical protein [Methylobacterium brachythecii]MBB3903986.1 hypothetical protein [Methylobacterium brachythecii]GLS42729.1 hypothetical protein GCM10007884_07140 [Methylobacterium brachythecii]